LTPAGALRIIPRSVMRVVDPRRGTIRVDEIALLVARPMEGERASR
jgi:hypothetical protein